MTSVAEATKIVINNSKIYFGLDDLMLNEHSEGTN